MWEIPKSSFDGVVEHNHNLWIMTEQCLSVFAVESMNTPTLPLNWTD